MFGSRIPSAPSIEPSRFPLAAEGDAEFVRHSQALASQTSMTRPEVLRPVAVAGSGGLSHW